MRNALFVPLLAASFLGGCALMSVPPQTGFPPLQVSATAPPKPIEKIAITDRIQFELGKAKLKPVSLPILDAVVAVLNSRPTVRKVEIEGHTDITGDAEKNRVLSQARAQAVLEYLVSKGVAAERLVAKGYGPDKPAQSNDTEAGREANRRVDFSIVDQD
ncbi:MAG TPA: OmpA family protein [Polyangia bacterium]|jgi:outer membrane protein OmpA-like peptidoglycan-associated protein